MFSGTLAERTLALVSIPSETGEEKRICDLLADWVRVTLPDASLLRWRNGLIVRPRRGEPDLPHLALVGHLDTVACAASQDVGIRDGRIWGCGASDMKAGVAIILALLEEQRAARVNLTGIFYDREEGPLKDNGLLPLMELTTAPGLAIVLEPTNNRIQAGCVGSLHARVTFRGRRAHSARPWEGDNALYHAIPVLQAMRERGRTPVECNGLTFFEVMTPTLASADGSRNVVPDRFEINVNLRFAPGRSSEDALRDLQDLVGSQAEVELVDTAPSGAVSSDHPILSEWARSSSLAIEAKQAWTDVAQLTSRGVPAINFGPGDPALAHQAQEHVHESALELCHQRLQSLIELLG